MTRSLSLALAFIGAPLAALARPVVGDLMGTSPDEATATLERAD